MLEFPHIYSSQICIEKKGLERNLEHILPLISRIMSNIYTVLYIFL